MKIGVISDTHGEVGLTRRALDVLDTLQVDLTLHCGDVGRVPRWGEVGTGDTENPGGAAAGDLVGGGLHVAADEAGDQGRAAEAGR